MAAPPVRTELVDTAPLPSNATARAGIGKLYDYVTGLLGASGNAADARAALGTGTEAQAQLATAFTTAGTSTAFTLTPAPALTALAANQRLRVKFHADAGATPTLAISGLVAKSLMYKDSAGAKQAVTLTQVPANWIADVEYDGTHYVVLQTADAVSAGTPNTFSKGQAGAIVPLTDGATITPDFSAGNNFQVTLGGSRTLGVPTSIKQGQSGMLDVVQDATGSRILAYTWPYVWVGGVVGALSTAAGALDELAYYVKRFAQSVVTVSNASPGVVSWISHGLTEGDRIQLTTTGGLPTGLAVSTTYYVKYVNADTFQLSATRGGAAINTSSAGTGVHTCTAITIRLSLAAGLA